MGIALVHQTCWEEMRVREARQEAMSEQQQEWLGVDVVIACWIVRRGGGGTIDQKDQQPPKKLGFALLSKICLLRLFS